MEQWFQPFVLVPTKSSCVVGVASLLVVGSLTLRTCEIAARKPMNYVGGSTE